MNKKMFIFALVALFATFGFVDMAAAQSVMGVAANKALEVFLAVRTIVYIVGGFGLVGLGFAAIFGKINWKWFAALAVGLAIIAAAGAIVEYATTGGGAYNNSTGVGVGSEFQDTMI
jgi:hypothetical protein